MAKRISKRDFLRYSVLGIGAAAAGLNSARALGKGIMSDGSPSPSVSVPVADLGKFSHESPYYISTARGVKCQICPNNCVLKDGQESICRTHVVKDGKLYSIAYGNPCSVHVDPIEKKPLFHFLPSSQSFSIATAGCTFACLNCQNWEISQESPRNTRNIDLMPVNVMEEAVSNGCRSVAYTYSEPIAFYEYTYDSAKFVRARGLKNLLISNGFINEKPLRDLCKYLDAANINLKSFSEEIYAKLNAGSLEPILNTLKILKEEGVWLEITNLIVPNWTDKPEMITEMCNWLAKNGFQDNPLHFSRFFPLYKLKNLPYTPLEILEKAREIALSAGLKYVYIGNVPGSPAENTYCPNCKKTIIERRGFTILANYIKDSNCKFCGTKIAGVWR
ncbi:MAG: AmmeMemoRadiSam system radical SAM enzyme [Bacteroidetes bacterium]|nr:AmmeMemoRadiSam system radical SAM enzyme [Bacteroidota bacterium]